jgi:hypothetical protein
MDATQRRGQFRLCVCPGAGLLVRKAITYPFEPKSIAHLRAGQFWAVPLSDGRFGCGCVLYVPSPSDPQPSLYLNTRIFLAGLMDWSSDEPPTAQAIAGCKLLEQGRVHVAAITDTGSKLLGQRDLELDGLSGLLQVSHRGGGTVWLTKAETACAPQQARSARPCPSCQFGGGESSCSWPKDTSSVANHDPGRCREMRERPESRHVSVFSAQGGNA